MPYIEIPPLEFEDEETENEETDDQEQMIELGEQANERELDMIENQY